MNKIGIALIMFVIIFSFIGGIVTPYGEDEVFMTEERVSKAYAYAAKAGDTGDYRIRGEEELSVEFEEKLKAAISSNLSEFEYGGILYEIESKGGQYTVSKQSETQLLDRYAKPGKKHWLGTDGNGMDIMTRLMYGGRVSLVIGIVVVGAETLIGLTVGGISGYYGRWVDFLLMRVADIINCIPVLPVYIIIGVMMESVGISPAERIYCLVMIMSITGWTGTAKMVRGQILMLREREFMTALEATGISVRRRIFVHLIPNIFPQLIVYASMGIGNVILSEATLSYLGIGVKYPFASWGNIITSVSDSYVMQNYIFVWMPAGILILITVLGFNLIGEAKEAKEARLFKKKPGKNFY